MNHHTTKPQAATYLDIFKAVDDYLQTHVGHALFTVSRLLPDGSAAERLYTTQPAAYPVSGLKPTDDSEWNQMLLRGECFVASHPDDFGTHFFDLDKIVALGLGSVINIPVHMSGYMVGTLNVLDKVGAYRGEVLAACAVARDMALPGYAAYEASLSPGGGRGS